jgi:tetratricopeptide (TPR) repeat protein/CHAT domain-containing protein
MGSKTTAVWLGRALRGVALAVALHPSAAVLASGQLPLDSARAADSAARLNQAAEKAFHERSRAGLERAVALWTNAGALSHQARDRGSEGAALDRLGKVHHELGRPDTALAYYRRALAIRREVGDRAGEGTTLDNIGSVHDDLSQRDSALAYFRRALAMRREVGDRVGLGTTLVNIGFVYDELGDRDSALAYYHQALLIQRAAGDRAGEGRTLNNIGIVQDNLARRDSALAYYRQALTIRREVADRKGEGITLSNIGIALAEMGQPDSALAYYHQALTIRQEVGDRAGEGTMLTNIGMVHHLLGRPDSALIYYLQGLAIQREVGDRSGEGTSLFAVGFLHQRLGRPDSALAYYREALAVQREVGDHDNEGTTLHNIGLVEIELGRPDSALAYDHQALAIQKRIRDRFGEGRTLVNIGFVHQSLGRPDSALAYYGQALAIVREIKDRTGEASALHNIGLMHQGLGRPDSALAYYRKALEVERNARARAAEGQTLTDIGSVHDGLAHSDSALAYYRQALAVDREVRERGREGATLGKVGLVQQRLGRPDSALAYYREALAIARDVGDRAGEAVTLDNIGSLQQHALSPGDLHETVAYYDSAAAVRGAVGVHAGGEANRVSYAEQWVKLFERWSLAWLARAAALGREPAALAALAASERGRSQALLDLMRGTSTAAAPGADLVAEGERLLTTARRGRTAVLSYLVTTDTLLIWIAPPQGALVVRRVAINNDSLARLVGDWRAGLGADEVSVRSRLAVREVPALDFVPEVTAGRAVELRPSRERARALGTRLADLVVPVEVRERLQDADEVLIVPHGPLALLAFAALPLDSADFLGTRYSLRYAPSLAVLAEAEARPALPSGTARAAALRRSIVVGNPAMPTVTAANGETITLSSLAAARAEGVWVARRLGTPVLSGTQATETAVRARLPTASLVHLATHGYAYATEARARSSFMALAPDSSDDGLLTVGEILDDRAVTLTAELVVLSGCQTGLGDLKQAEGTVGLQRAFLAKGARSVLVSLWSVSDAATELLMKRFYSHWLDDRDHPGKAEALRRAQNEVRQTPGFEHPRYWAGFQLVGAR